MPTTDKRVDAYIDKSADFAKPILIHLRNLVHSAVPGVEETMKWSFPHFDHRGIMCAMAAFKQHCTFGFWKASIMSDPDGILARNGEEAMGHLGRITKLADLPPDRVLVKYVREAARLNSEGVKLPPRPKVRKRPVKTPAVLLAALKKSPKARATFEIFSDSHRREYIEWITEAKTDETRHKRLRTAIEWLSEGKPRNWKYARK